VLTAVLHTVRHEVPIAVLSVVHNAALIFPVRPTQPAKPQKRKKTKKKTKTRKKPALHRERPSVLMLNAR